MFKLNKKEAEDYLIKIFDFIENGDLKFNGHPGLYFFHTKKELKEKIDELLNKNDIYAAFFSKNGNKESQQFMQEQLKNILDRSLLSEDVRQEQQDSLTDIYATTYYVNAVFGLSQTWIQRKRKESPEQIVALLMALINRSDSLPYS